MHYFKNIELPDFLTEVKASCLKWAEEIVEHGNPHSFLTLRSITHSKINNALNNLDFNAVEDIVGIRKSRILKQRALKMLREYGVIDRIIIDQYDIPEEMAEYVKDEIHTRFGISRDECTPIVQIQNGGEMLHPHYGHARQASLFCLLKGEGEVTKWYKETEPFEIVSEFRIPDVTKLEVAVEHVFQENQWLLFNHREWHSVHRKSNVGVRINFGIDFNTMDINEVIANTRVPTL